MAGLQKYVNFLNKKRKEREGDLNLEINVGERPEISFSNGCKRRRISKDLGNAEDYTNGRTESEMDDNQEDQKTYPDLRKERMRAPKLYLRPLGQRSMLTSDEDPSSKYPVSFSCIQTLLLQALGHHRSIKEDPPSFCTLLRSTKTAKVVVVIVDDVGISELTDIIDPKRLTKGDEDDAEASETNGGTQNGSPLHMITKSLPVSLSSFPLKLLLYAPTQHCARPLRELFTCPSEPFLNKVLRGCESLKMAKKQKRVVLCNTNVKPRVESIPQPAKLPIIEEHHQDNMNRTELLLSFQEMKIHGYSLPLISKKPMNDDEFRPLHPVYERVTRFSPMYGIDCEMCMTRVGSELTRVSVVDEQMRVLYTSFVKPSNEIVDYLTRYSGILPRHLKGVKTTLQDVQRNLRKLLPKNCILVGHSLNNDFDALKITHPYVIDTSLIYNLSGHRKFRSKLKLLSSLFLNKEIQRSNVKGHDPAEDAAASLELALLKLRHDVTYGDLTKGGYLPLTKQGRKEVAEAVQKDKEKSLEEIKQELRASLFAFCRGIRIKTTIISLNGYLQYFNDFTEGESELLEMRSHYTVNDVFHDAIQRCSSTKFLICYCKLFDRLKEVNSMKTKSKLRSLDSNLKKLHDSLPPKSLIVTMFTGSSMEVPLDYRSNGILLINVVGQPREAFFK